MSRTSLVPPTSQLGEWSALAAQALRRQTSEGALSAYRSLFRHGGALPRLVELCAWRYATLRGRRYEITVRMCRVDLRTVMGGGSG